MAKKKRLLPRLPRVRKANALICYAVRLRDAADDDPHMWADTMAEFLAFNTWKFMSLASAIAYCRQKKLDPRDYVIVRAEFPQPKVLATYDLAGEAGEVADGER